MEQLDFLIPDFIKPFVTKGLLVAQSIQPDVKDSSLGPIIYAIRQRQAVGCPALRATRAQICGKTDKANNGVEHVSRRKPGEPHCTYSTLVVIFVVRVPP